MKVESIKTHIVHPARPPPAGAASTIILSNNDQVMPRMHINMLFYYAPAKLKSKATPQDGTEGRKPTDPDEDDDDDFLSLEILKESLAETLSLYYPLAGRYTERANGGLDIDCTKNEQGVELREVVVSGSFEQEISGSGWQPVPASQLFLPTFDYANPPHITDTPLLQAQLTRFECGRVCLGVAIHHNACDGLGMSTFVRTWATISLGNKHAASTLSISSSSPSLTPPLPPLLDRSVMKANDPPRPSFDHIEYTQEYPSPPAALLPMVAGLFEFGPQALEKLKHSTAAAESESSPSSFSSFEAFSGHVWRCVTRARELHLREPEKQIKLGFAVDGRKRFDPPLPENYLGNANFYGLATSSAGDLVSKPLSYAAGLVHEAIARISDQYMRSALDWVEEKQSPVGVFPSFHSFLGPDLAISSWARFPAYEIDFGWGTPEFFGIKDSAWDGLVVPLPGASPGSINVLVGLDVKSMSNLLSDPDFRDT